MRKKNNECVYGRLSFGFNNNADNDLEYLVAFPTFRLPDITFLTNHIHILKRFPLPAKEIGSVWTAEWQKQSVSKVTVINSWGGLKALHLGRVPGLTTHRSEDPKDWMSNQALTGWAGTHWPCGNKSFPSPDPGVFVSVLYSGDPVSTSSKKWTKYDPKMFLLQIWFLALFITTQCLQSKATSGPFGDG